MKKIMEVRFRRSNKGIKTGTFRKVNSSIAGKRNLGAVNAILSPKFLEEEKLSFDAAFIRDHGHLVEWDEVKDFNRFSILLSCTALQARQMTRGNTTCSGIIKSGGKTGSAMV